MTREEMSSKKLDLTDAQTQIYRKYRELIIHSRAGEFHLIEGIPPTGLGTL
jgi:hypothetical protein